MEINDLPSLIRHENSHLWNMIPACCNEKSYASAIIVSTTIFLNIIHDENTELGRVLINNKFPFAIIKFKDKKFKFEKILKCGNASIRIKKPNWFNID